MLILFDFQDVLEALKSLSSFFQENNLRSRRNLRSDIEHRSLAINEDFVQCFTEVKEQLDSVYGHVKAMNECCEDMTSRLKVCHFLMRLIHDYTTIPYVRSI